MKSIKRRKNRDDFFSKKIAFQRKIKLLNRFFRVIQYIMKNYKQDTYKY